MIRRTARTSRSASTRSSSTDFPKLGKQVAAAGLALLGLFATADALAAGEKDAEANKLYDAAMNDDYLNVELGKAEKKLNDAIKKCGTDGCTPKVLAKVYLGLGVIHFANNKPDDAKAAFVNGLKVDASATLDATFKGADIDKLFDEAKKSAGSSGTGGKGGDSGTGGKGGDTGGSATPAKPAGDLKHTPPAEQQINTPVPIYIEVPEDLGVKKVTLRYKPFGATNWKPLDMAKVGDGWGVEVPCTEVTTTGDLKYYITADDDAGTVATAGSRSEPYKIAIKNEIEGDSPSLPGKKPPKACSSSTDCPPGFPGCVDSQCGSDSDCKTNLYCSKKEGESDGTCKRKSSEGKPWGSSCSESGECGEGLTCVEGSCQEGEKGPGGGGGDKGGKKKLNMISVEASLDLLLINSRDNVCSGTTDGSMKATDANRSDGSFVCFYNGANTGTTPTSGQFYGVPVATAATNGVTGGFGVAGGRVGAGFDRQISQKLNLTLGAHLGFAFSDFPTSETGPNKTQVGFGHSQANGFMPFWAEGRVGYNLFGGWVEKMQFKPYGYLGFGFGQVNAGVGVTVCDRKDTKGLDLKTGGTKGCPTGTGYVSRQANLDAYQITGLDYVPIGLGTTFGITDSFGVKAELRFLFMLPTFGVVFQPSIGPVYAF
ncbi:MAG: dickkopf-related protein [Polyangiaceae bacterium]